jgi:replicative DNA helicase
MEEADNLSKYGNVFQSKCVVALLTDKEFLEQSLDIVNSKYFENEALSWIVDKIFWYFNQYRNQPTLEVFKTEVGKIEHNDVLKTSVVQQLRTVYQNLQADDVIYIKKEFLEFCKNQAIKNAILGSVDLLKAARYDEIKVLIDKATRAGSPRNVGHDWKEDFVARSTRTSRNTVATRWDAVNAILDGGLGAGELGCVVAPSGAGKSWLLQDIGQYAATQGKIVAHYTLELGEEYTGTRYDTIMTSLTPNAIRANPQAVQDGLEKITGQSIIKFFPARSINVNAIHTHIKHLINLGKRPDLIIIDYADLMRATEKCSARHEELGLVYEEIRGMLGELQLPGWTASQSQRSSTQDDIIEADKIAGSYEKIMKCDFIMSLSRKAEDKVSSTGRVFVMKNRLGPDGLTYPAHIDTEKGDFFIHDGESREGMELNARMNTQAEEKKQLFHGKMLDVFNKQQATPSALVSSDPF